MRWTAALLLALAVHVAGMGSLWLWRTAQVPPRANLERAAVEVVIATSAREPVSFSPPREPPPHPSPRPSAHPPSARAPASWALPSAVWRRERDPKPNLHLTPTPAPARPATPVAVGAPRSTMLDLRPRDMPASTSTATSAPTVASPSTAGVDLSLRRDPTAPMAVSPAAGAGQILETPGLRGEVGRDGSLRIRDKAAVSLGGDLTAPGRVLKDWLKDPVKHAQDRDGTVALLRGKFDVTDTVMRALGQDPYRAARMKMLDDTREQRLTLAARDRSARQGQQLAALPSALRNIWNDSSRPAPERRRIIFQLWDECQEAAEGEAESASVGAHARRIIVLFIRARVGADSADAYPKEELTALNEARQSRQRFDPYGLAAL